MFGLWSQAWPHLSVDDIQELMRRFFRSDYRTGQILLVVHSCKSYWFSLSLSSYANQYVSCAMHAKQRAKITEQVSFCYLPVSRSKMVNLANMTLKNWTELSSSSSRLVLVPGWESSWGKLRLLMGGVLERSAGGAHPVDCVGPKAHATPNQDQITSGDKSHVLTPHVACILAQRLRLNTLQNLPSLSN